MLSYMHAQINKLQTSVIKDALYKIRNEYFFIRKADPKTLL